MHEIHTPNEISEIGKDLTELSHGAQWLRWEPHIHGPGTILNNQFRGSNPFEEYLASIEAVTPVLKAIGITDYYNVEVYELVLEAKKQGRLPECDLLFPNIEMRLDVATVSGSFVNLHLLVCPDDPGHLVELNRFLAKLSFHAYGDNFRCTKDDLIRLGKKAEPTIVDDRKALQVGSVQFKVSNRELRNEFLASDWAKANILIAIAGGSDGSGGVRAASDTTLREELDKMADIIFASSPNQREFWLGKKALKAEEIEARYRCLKPCMHGSDAHRPEDVGVPKGERYTWIKGIAKFDSLRQACIDPEGRAFIGPNPPLGANPSQIIRKVRIQNTEWCQTPIININSGLVAIIGARGSGKTALAEIIAAGCDSIPEEPTQGENNKSFLNRAKSELQEATVSIDWGADKEKVVRSLYYDNTDSDKYQMARYLSQQFVDDLCSSDGVTDKLLKELERIIFNSHDVNQREGTIEFAELLELKASRPRANREREEKALEGLCDRIGLELEKNRLVLETKEQVKVKEQLIKQYIRDRSILVTKGSEERVKRLGELAAAADKVRNNVRYFSERERSLLGMQDDVENTRINKAPEDLRSMQQKHTQVGLKPDEWASFLTDFTGDVDKVISDHLQEARRNSEGWKGAVPMKTPPSTSYIAPDADLEKQTLSLLEAEIARLTALVSADRNTALRFGAVTQKITQEQTALNNLKEKLADYVGAKDRIDALRTERDSSYGRIFEAILQEEAVLRELYIPIMTKLSAAGGTLHKMSFTIKRIVNVDCWAEEGEELFDLRGKSDFKGKGTLKQLAEEKLLSAWEIGTVDDVLAAMKKFQKDHAETLFSLSKVPKSEKENFRAWAMQFAKWLYGTNHIQITYGVDYDGVDIRKLSPGTRGIVLLLLYLALDEEDDRPLIIDQPEENLDPKSIYDELVGLFIDAKKRRQVIMVTHNANLVINTDADQIIIASTGERLQSGMPRISYLSGGLEEADIRKEVCDILEGGEKAFKKRAQRLRVGLR